LFPETSEALLKPIIKIDTIFDDPGQVRRFKCNGLYGYVDARKKIIIQPIYKEAGPFIEGKAKVKDVKGRKYIIDERGICLKNCPK